MYNSSQMEFYRHRHEQSYDTYDDDFRGFSISKYESNDRDIPASTIVSLSEALDTSPNYLLLGPDGIND